MPCYWEILLDGATILEVSAIMPNKVNLEEVKTARRRERRLKSNQARGRR
jgi:heme exporter protein D